MKLKRPINIAWLYYRSASRRYTSVVGLYHHLRGRRGYRILAPFYWNFWNKKRESRVVFPFWWQFHNKKTRRHHRVFLMFHHLSSPEERQFNIWPLLFTSGYGKKGFAFTIVPLFHYGRKGKRWSAFSLLPIPWYASRRPGKRRFVVFPFTGGMLSPERSFVWTLPLNFYWRRKDKKRWLFLPLYYGATDGHKHKSALFPFYYYSREGNYRHKFVSLLAIYSRNRREGWRYFLWTVPPMFFSRSREREVDLVFPFYLRHYNRETRAGFHLVPPFVYYRDHRQRNAVLFPLFWYFGDARTRSYVSLLFPLFYRHRTQDGERVTVLGPWYLRQRKSGWASGLFPVLFFGSSRKSAHAVVFPLFWHLRDRQKGRTFTLLGNLYVRTGRRRWSFGLVPLLFGGKSQRGHHFVLFPLVWHKTDRQRRRAFTVLGPAFWWRRGESFGHGLFPLYWYQRSYLPSGHVASSLLVFPLLFQLHTPRHHIVMTPLGGSVHDRLRRRRTTVIANIFWHRSPRTRSFGILPFYVYHKRLGAAGDEASATRTHFFFPLCLYRKGPRRTSLVLFPLLWHFKSPKERSWVFAPLYWHLRQKNGWRADVLFPVFWYLRKKKERFFSVLPVYYHRTAKTRRFGIFPLLHVGWDRDVTYGHFFPLVWHYRNRKTGTGVTIAGPFYHVRKKRNYNAGVLPLVFWGRKGPKTYAVGFPLVWSFGNDEKRSRTTFVGPVFYHRRGAATGGGLAPLLWVVRGPGGHRQVTLFPLFHFRRKATRVDFWTPLFGFGRDRALAHSYGYAGPVYWQSSGKKNTQVVFPLFWRFHNRTSRTTHLVAFPLYFGRISPEERFDVVFPLVWHKNTVTSRTVLVLPLFYDHLERDEARTTAVVPFFYRRRVHHKRETTWIFPPSLYIKTKPRSTDVVLFPLVWHFDRGEKSTTVAFPLYWDFKRGRKRTSIFFPLFWRFDRGHKVHTVVLNTYYGYSRARKTWQFIFFPLLEIARKRPGDIKWSVLGGLFGYERIGRNRSMRLFFFRIRLKPTQATPLPPPARRRRAAFSSADFYPI